LREETRQDTSDMGRGEAASGHILHGSDQKELASTRPEIVSLIERRRLSTVLSRPKQTILPGAVAGQTTKTTKRRKDKIWQKQKRLKRSSQKRAVKKAKGAKTPLRHQRRAKWVAVICEGGSSCAPIVARCVISSNQRHSIGGTRAAIAEAIISINPEICDQAPLTPFESNGTDRAGLKTCAVKFLRYRTCPSPQYRGCVRESTSHQSDAIIRVPNK